MNTKHRPIRVALFLAFFAMLWLALNLRQLPTTQAEWNGGDVISLGSMDLDATVALLPLDWDYWPDVLYTSEDFAAGTFEGGRKFSGAEDERAHHSGTYRAMLQLPAGGVYSMYGWSLNYATRIYVNGTEILSVGTVAPDAEGFTPRIQRYTLPVVTEAGTVEIIIQYANFAHPEGGAMRELAFSTYQNIQRYAVNAMLPTYLFSGALLLLAAFYLLQGMLYLQRELAGFSLCCLLLALRSQPLVLSLMPMAYDWYGLYRAFFIGTSMGFPCFLLLTYFLHPAWFRRWVLPVTFALVGAVDIAVLLLPVSSGVRLGIPAVLLALPCALYYFVRLLRMFPHGSTSDRLSIFGLLLFLLSFLVELLLANTVPFITRSGLAPFGMTISVLCYMLALALRQRENAIRLERERERSESLARQDRMKTELLANVTHELKTPLTVISGYAQDTLLELGDASPDEAILAFNQRHIVTEADRLDRMVNQLLDTAAIEGKHARWHMEPVSLVALLRRMADAHFPMLNKNGNRLELRIPEDLPDVPADGEALEQVLLNLLDNAARHTREGTITLSLKAVEGGQQIAVSDTGEGMDEELRAQVFKQYVNRKNNVSGRTGLGLYICKKIIDAHGGRVWLDSEPGKGTAVTFWLPEKAEDERT